ncbi:MAG: hypothetical protein ACFFGZ_12250 [Candidatus Thorarchaeota archaeon]
MSRIWPPKMPDLLKALKDREPFNLYNDRPVEHRIIGACMLESHFLAGLLRYRNIPVRIRAGYFKDIRSNAPFIVNFWENVSREKRVQEDLLKEDPEKWKQRINAFTIKQNHINHYIEHWSCEYWNSNSKQWRLLDANNTFLKAHSNITVGYHLPRDHYELAFEAWMKMRTSDDFNPDQYAEEQQDGRSHIRSQLLWDFFSLLNHDLAGYDQPTREAYIFLKETKFEEISNQELEELDNLAHLLSKPHSKDDLVEFYYQCAKIRLESAEKDEYSFV